MRRKALVHRVEPDHKPPGPLVQLEFEGGLRPVFRSHKLTLRSGQGARQLRKCHLPGRRHREILRHPRRQRRIRCRDIWVCLWPDTGGQRPGRGPLLVDVRLVGRHRNDTEESIPDQRCPCGHGERFDAAQRLPSHWHVGDRERVYGGHAVHLCGERSGGRDHRFSVLLVRGRYHWKLLRCLFWIVQAVVGREPQFCWCVEDHTHLRSVLLQWPWCSVCARVQSRKGRVGIGHRRRLFANNGLEHRETCFAGRKRVGVQHRRRSTVPGFGACAWRAIGQQLRRHEHGADHAECKRWPVSGGRSIRHVQRWDKRFRDYGQQRILPRHHWPILHSIGQSQRDRIGSAYGPAPRGRGRRWLGHAAADFQPLLGCIGHWRRLVQR